MAGCASAEAFSRRGWQVLVLEAENRLGGAVACIPLIAQHPALTPDFDLRSRLLVQALQMHHRLRAGPAADIAGAFEVCGRLQPMDAARAARCAAFVSPALARVASGRDGPGIWFADCAALSPARWWQALQKRAGISIRRAVTVDRLVRLPSASRESSVPSWHVYDQRGACLAAAEVVVLACREDSFRLAGMQADDHGRLRLSASRVWTARADGGRPDEDPGAPALLPVTGNQGLALTRPGRFWLRAEQAYQYGRLNPASGPEDQPMREFLARPSSWHPGPRGVRLQLRDNLPMMGAAPDLERIAEHADELARNDRLPLPRRAGLYLLTGLAGRGALYSVMGAEMIAAQANGEPDFLPPSLTRAVDPARFIKRRLQRAWSNGWKGECEKRHN